MVSIIKVLPINLKDIKETKVYFNKLEDLMKVAENFRVSFILNDMQKISVKDANRYRFTLPKAHGEKYYFFHEGICYIYIKFHKI
jgi:hypothetical protein